MTINIVACGETASIWNGEGFSIGVNDCFRFEKKTDCLLVANGPLKFPQERLNIIKNSKPQRFFSHLKAWKQYFPQMEEIKLRSWDGHFYKDFIVNTDTSPTIAMGLARKLGASKIILWGVDFVTHKIYNVDNAVKSNEIRQIKQICEALKHEGVLVSIGASGSVLSQFLPIEPCTTTQQ